MVLQNSLMVLLWVNLYAISWTFNDKEINDLNDKFNQIYIYDNCSWFKFNIKNIVRRTKAISMSISQLQLWDIWLEDTSFGPWEILLVLLISCDRSLQSIAYLKISVVKACLLYTIGTDFGDGMCNSPSLSWIETKVKSNLFVGPHIPSKCYFWESNSESKKYNLFCCIFI